MEIFKTMHILIFVLSLLTTVVSNNGNDMYNSKRPLEEQAIVEYYKIDEYLYMFFSERVTWEEAETICPNYDARLAVVNTAFKANKLAAAMAQSNIEMEDIWIGGQRSDAGIWTWLNEKHIPSQPNHGFPPWVRNPNRPWKQCVGLDRFAIDSPLFVDLDCQLPKPFICQREVDAPGNLDVALPSHMISADKSTYILYHSRVSWATAVGFCRMRGYRLAIISNNNIAKLISTAMIRSRPSFENVWISGHFHHNQWSWLPTGETIQSYPDENNYPPWHHNSTRQKSGCILFDRHVCDDPVFLAFDCDHKRDFVCEKYVKSIKHHKKSNLRKFSYKGWEMILVLKEMSWYDAQDFCQSKNGYLTEVYDYDMMKTITTVMSDQESEPVHVWLGGMLINDTWFWVHSNKAIPTTTDETGFVPWCHIEQKENNDCLNMDREAHDKPVLYGLDCLLKQPFVCTIATTLTSVCKHPAVTVKRDSSIFTIFFTPYPYELAFEDCTRAGGKLAEVKQEDIKEIANTISTTKDDACTEMDFWVQGKSDCFQLNLAKKTTEIADDCSKRQGFICKAVCTKPESSGIFNQTKWKCEQQDAFACKANCRKDTILVGSDTIKCSDSGWTTNSNKTTYLPLCKKRRSFVLDQLDQVEDAIKDYSGFLFIVDESYSISVAEWWIQLQFVASMVQVFPLSVNFTMGLILFSDKVRVVIPFEATDTCKVLETINKLRPKDDTDYTFIKEALEEADNQITKFHNNQSSIIFFVSDGDGNGDDFDEILEKLKQRNLMVSLGISEEPLNDLNVIASMQNNILLMYKFEEFNSFKKFTLDLLKFSSKALSCTKKRYSLLKHEVCKQSAIPLSGNSSSPSAFVIFFTPHSYDSASKQCINAGGKLATIQPKYVDNVVHISAAVKDDVCKEMNFWVNSKYKCSQVDVQSRAIENAQDCLKEQGFICEIACNTPSSSGIFNQTKWNCEKDEKLECVVECKENTILTGADTITCTNSGWVTTSNKTTYLPSCQNVDVKKEQIDSIDDFMEANKGILFIVDESNSITVAEWWINMQFITSIIQMHPLSSRFPMGLILFSSEVRVPIPYGATDTCKVLETIRKLQPVDTEFTFTKEALEEADKQITSFQDDQPTTIFFISNGDSNGEEYNEILAKLKQHHLIISVGINTEPLNDLNQIASMKGDNLLMYKFREFNSFQKFAMGLTKYRSRKLKCQPHLYVLPNGTNITKPMKVQKRHYVPTNETLCDDNPTSIKLKGVTYTTFFTRSTYSEAKLHCNSEGGRLANLKGNQLELIINSLVDQANICNDDELWINRRSLPCTTLNIDQKQIINCSKDVDSTRLSFICENGCPEHPTDSKYIYNNWNCKNQGKLKNCQVKCKERAVMVGTDTIICSPDGWVTSNNQITNFPVCLIDKDFEVAFISQIRNLKEQHDGFLFIFDKSFYSNQQNGTLRQLDFMKILLEISPPTTSFPVGLILFDEDAKVPIPYNETDFCSVRRTLHHIKHTAAAYEAKIGLSFYKEALLVAEEQIKTLQPTRKTLIFFISDHANNGNNYTDIPTNLKEKHTIFSIGSGYDALKDLSSIASMISENLLMYTFKNYKHLDYTMKNIKQHYGKHYKCAGTL